MEYNSSVIGIGTASSATIEALESNATRMGTIGQRSPHRSMPSTKDREGIVHSDIVAEWCSDQIKRLGNAAVSNETELKQDELHLWDELKCLIDETIRNSTPESYEFLVSILDKLMTIEDHMRGFSEAYVDKILKHIDLQRTDLDHELRYRIRRSLQAVFPLRVPNALKGKKSEQVHSPLTTLKGEEPKSFIRRKTPAVAHSMLLPDGTNPFVLERPGDLDDLHPHQLTLGDLRHSIAAVGREAALRESVWQSSGGMLMKAMSADFPEDPRFYPRPNEEPEISDKQLKKMLADVANGQQEREKSQAEEALPLVPMNGRDAVKYFVKLYHLGKVKHMYFNLAQNRHFRPYDLVAVAKHKLKPEHYVFSTFGVLYVKPDEPAESMSLGNWLREAVLYKAVSCIPFFKHYLTRRCFRAWLAFKKCAEYTRNRKAVEATLLQVVPTYGSAYFSVAKLLLELASLKFLPMETGVSYSLQQFEKIINANNSQSTMYLERFYQLVRDLMDHTIQEQFQKLSFWKKQVASTVVFTKESLYISNRKQAQREENLQKVKDETNRLGNFIKLIDQVILSYMIAIARSNSSHFVSNVMQISQQNQREALFKAEFEFDEHGSLVMTPAKEDFYNKVMCTLEGIPEVLCDTDSGIDAEPVVRKRSADMSASPEVRYGLASVSRAAEGSGRKSIGQMDPHSQIRAGTQRGAHDMRQAKAGTSIVLDTPAYFYSDMPQKSDDEMGIKTPVVALPMAADIEIKGEGFIGQYAPLARSNVEGKLHEDKLYMGTVKDARKLLEEAFEEVDQYIVENEWLGELYRFCKEWNIDTKFSWKGMQTFQLEANPRAHAHYTEQQLSQVRTWSEKVKNFDKAFVTTNRIFLVDCGRVHNFLVPCLAEIYKEMISYVAREAWTAATSFCDELLQIAAYLKNKKDTIEDFASYARKVSEYKQSTTLFQLRVEYIKSLFEVIRMGSRQLTPEEEVVEGQVVTNWELFLAHMQDAAEYVNMQTPIHLQALEESYQSYLLEVEQLQLRITTGMFLDPMQDPTKVLFALRQIRERFYELMQKLQQASKWKEAISSQAYEILFLQRISSIIHSRQELWKYVEVSMHTIKEWKQQLFRKMNVQKALDKVNEWLTVATQMHVKLSADDPVLSHWISSLQDFKQDLPLLQTLAADALKAKHWKAIFVGMGENYDGSWQPTVAELLSYNLGKHAILIGNIFARAKAEFQLEQKLSKLHKMWNEKDLYFRLAKHIPDSVYSSGQGKIERKKSNLERFRQDRVPSALPKGLDVSSDDLFVLVNSEELKYLLEDSQVTLQQMLASPYISEHRDATEVLYGNLRQADEIVDLWCDCQTKWLYLMKVFENPETYRRMSSLSFKFEGVHSKMKEIQRTVVSDPRVMSIVTHARGEKGYRLLQGENLIRTFMQLIRTQEELIQAFSRNLATARHQFPRLYFASDDEIVKMLAVSRNPQRYLPVARKCFPGLTSLKFDLPSELQTTESTSLDYVLNADKLEVSSLCGKLEEQVPLPSRLKPSADIDAGTQWLSQLETLMKESVMRMQSECVQERLEKGMYTTAEAISELDAFEQASLKTQVVSDIKSNQFLHQKQKFANVLLRIPIQCILVCEAVLWQLSVTECLLQATTTKKGLQTIRENLENLLNGLTVSVSAVAARLAYASQARLRLTLLLHNLIVQANHLRDITCSLLVLPNPCLQCFEWAKVLKLHLTIRPITRVKASLVPSTAGDDRTRLLLRHHIGGAGHDGGVEIVPQPGTASVTGLLPPTPPPLPRPSVSRRPNRFGSSITGEKGQIEKPTEVTAQVLTTHQIGNLSLHQLDFSYDYGYEYLGPQQSIVLTPLVERAQMSLAMALRDFRCGTLVGSAASGKTETIRDFSRALGQCLYTITGSQDLNLKMINQFLSGVVQSGCWALFDESDRLTVQLMSIFAYQLHIVCSALNVLKFTRNQEYNLRGQTTFDKPSRSRSNSVTTLHTQIRDKPLTVVASEIAGNSRARRHSVSQEIGLSENNLYVDHDTRPLPLFYERSMSIDPMTQEATTVFDMHSPSSYRRSYLGHLVFNGQLLRASENAACFLVLNVHNDAVHSLPESFRLLMRPFAMVRPDISAVVESRLLSWGFEPAKVLTRRLALFMELGQAQLSGCWPPPPASCLPVVLLMLNAAAAKLHALPDATASDYDMEDDEVQSNPETGDIRTPEVPVNKSELALVYGINAVMLPRLEHPEDHVRLRNILRDIFPMSYTESSASHDPELVSAIQEQMQTSGLHLSAHQLTKVLQFWNAVQQSQTVLLTGPSGSGKTLCYKVLSQAVNKLHAVAQENQSHEDSEAESGQSLAAQVGRVRHKTKSLHGSQESKISDLGRKSPASRGYQKWSSPHRTFGRMGSLLSPRPDAVQQDATYPRVDLHILCPSSLYPSELFGFFDDKLWHDGLLAKLLRNASTYHQAGKWFTENFQDKKNRLQIDTPSVIENWIVLDGDLTAEWVDGMTSYTDANRSLSLPNGEAVASAGTATLIYETGSLVNASPASVSRCTIVHCAMDTVQWKSLIESWTAQARHKWLFTPASLKMINQMVNETFASTLKFLAEETTPALDTHLPHNRRTYSHSVRGIHEVSSFIRIMTAMLNIYLLRETDEPAADALNDTRSHTSNSTSTQLTSRQQFLHLNSLSGQLSKSFRAAEEDAAHQTNLIKSIFAYAYIWGFGGHLDDRSRYKFDQFAKECLYRCSHPVTLPRTAMSYDLFVDVKQAALVKVADKPVEKLRNLPPHYIVTPDIERYYILVDLLTSGKQPVLLTGAAGVGKTSFVHSMIMTQQSYTRVNMSPLLTSTMFQDMVMSRLQELKLKASYAVGAGGGQMKLSGERLHFFLEDLNAGPVLPGTRTMPILESVRQMIGHGLLYDNGRHVFEDTSSISFLAACTKPGSIGSAAIAGGNGMSGRLIRLFNVINLFSPSDDSLHSLYGKALRAWLEEFPSYAVQHHHEFAKAMIQGILDMYRLVEDKFRASPTHAHYVFSLHDVARIIEGILLLSPRKAKAKPRRANKNKDASKSARDKFKSLSVKDSKDAKKHNVHAALPMMPVIARLWCHEVARTFADRLLTDNDEIWFKKTLEDQAQKHFCTASEGWLATHEAVKFSSTVIYEESGHVYEHEPTEVVKRGTPVPVRIKGTPMPVASMSATFDEEDDEDGQDGEDEDDSMTEVTADVVTPFTDQDDNMTNVEPVTPMSEGEYLDNVTPFTEGTVNLPDIPITPDEERPTLDYMRTSSRSASESDSDSSDSSDSPKEGSDETTSTNKAATMAAMMELRSGSKALSGSAAAAAKAAVAGVIKKKRSLRQADGKRGVTFKMGLIADKEVKEEYKGALMTFDEIRGHSEDLLDIVFSKFFVPMHAESLGVSAERGYAEYTEQQLQRALEACTALQNMTAPYCSDLVFVREAIRHAARLSRVLGYPGAHALLLGLPCSNGRSTLTKLAAYAAQCKLYEVTGSEADVGHSFHDLVKQCCYTAAVLGRSTVLYVESGVQDEILTKVCSLMVEGTFPGLYSEAELQHIAAAMTPGQVQTKRVDKIEQAFERFLKKVRSSMHVVVCLNYRANKSKVLYDKLRCFPQLVSRATCVDCFKPWTAETYQAIARVWLPKVDGLHWHSEKFAEQVAGIAAAMAYMHKSAEATAEQLFCHQKADIVLFTPRTFLELVHSFNVIANGVIQHEQNRSRTLQQVLAKVDEAFSIIDGLALKAHALEPLQKEAESTVNRLKDEVSTERQAYIQALEECKAAEESLVDLQRPLDLLRKEADAEFDKVNPTYYAAIDAVKMLDQHDIDELKSFRVPPDLIRIVGDCLCVIFGKDPPSWELAKTLMFRKNFFEDLEFYDKNHIPEKIYNKLQAYIERSDFSPSVIANGSKAAASVCSWMHALYRYSSIYRQIAPKLAALLEAEEALSTRQAELGQKRIGAEKLKARLEKLIEDHRIAVLRLREIEKRLKAMEKSIADAKTVMKNMDIQNRIWRADMAECRARISTAAGDAVLAAGMCCYLGAFDSHTRQQIISDWHQRCLLNDFSAQVRLPTASNAIDVSSKQEDMPSIHDKIKASQHSMPDSLRRSTVVNPFKQTLPNLLLLRPHFSLESILSSFDELSAWKKKGLGLDTHSFYSALILRQAAANGRHMWPLLIDPDGQGEAWIKNIHKSIGSSDHVHNEDDGSSNDEQAFQANRSADLRGTRSSTSSFRSFTLKRPSISPQHEPFASTISAADRVMISRTSGEIGLPALALRSLSMESLMVIPDDVIVIPEDGIIVIQADSPDCDKGLINAIVHGVPVLLTNIERKRISPAFDNVVRRNILKDKDNKMHVMIGSTSYEMHPKFRLYLSTTTPLLVNGEGPFSVPIGYINAVDLSISQQGKIDRLLHVIMQNERPDFEVQSRSIEAGILHHKQELSQENEIIKNKVLHLENAILDDSTMFEALLSCQQSMGRSMQILDETRDLQRQLEQRRESYLPVALASASTYDVIERLALLSPYYRLPFAQFLGLCTETIRARQRGKAGATGGALPARCQELIDAITTAVHRHVTSMLHSSHVDAYATLVAIHRMLAADNASTQEVVVFVNGLDRQSFPASAGGSGYDTVGKPSWMSLETWFSCCKLEGVFSCFKGLATSLANYNVEWKEYFSCPVALVSQLPGEVLNLTLLQKCILWRVCRPDRFSEVCQNLVLAELGPSVVNSTPYELDELINANHRNWPVILLQPNPASVDHESHDFTGYSSEDGTDLVRRFASQQPPWLRRPVREFSFGDGISMAQAERALGESMTSGSWLVMTNCHLAPKWSESILRTFKSIIESIDSAIESSEPSWSAASRAASELPATFHTNTDANGGRSCFRLWMVTRMDQERLLPGVLISKSIKFTIGHWNSRNVEGTAKMVHLCLTAAGVQDDTHEASSTLALKLGVLHGSLLLMRSYDRAAFAISSHWSAENLMSMLDQLGRLRPICNTEKAFIELCKLAYGGHCIDAQDRTTVEATVSRLLDHNNVQVSQLQNLLAGNREQAFVKRSHAPKQVSNIEEFLVKLMIAAAAVPEACKQARIITDSKQTLRSILAIGSCSDAVLHGGARSTAFERVESVLSGLASSLQNMAELPAAATLEASRDQLNPIDAFLFGEVEARQHELALVQQELDLLRSVVRCERDCDAEMERAVAELHAGRVPDSWRRRWLPAAGYRSGFAAAGEGDLVQWVRELEESMRLLCAYADQQTRPPAYCLSAFVRPDLLLQAVLVCHARAHLADINELCLEGEFLAAGARPTGPPVVGCYVTGLRLHNATWDAASRTIVEASVSGSPPQLQQQQHGPNGGGAAMAEGGCTMPVLWFKPEARNGTREEMGNGPGDVYACPVYMSHDVGTLDEHGVVCHVKLRTSTSRSQCEKQRVFLSSKMTLR